MSEKLSEFISKSPEQTQQWGGQLAAIFLPNDVVALTGDIGAGKTTFVQGAAKGLGVPDGAVVSPSFVLVREYKGRMPVFHADLFRLEGMSQAANVGLEEYYSEGGVTFIEWANQIPGILPDQFLEIQFEVIDPETRKLTVVPHGERYQKRIWKK